ncbi:MAG: AbrB/MazE/SpoVT family DNA-binding domain-containing protein [Nitrospira sp.]|nr:AbrB/MazE/SpoVT family DNA-binding domain-containing protein [Nitrospira sp.]
MKTTLDKFGRVVIPKEIRDNLGLKPGAALGIETGDRGVILKPSREKSPVQLKEGLLIFTGKAEGSIIDAVRIHREDRIKKSAVRRK